MTSSSHASKSPSNFLPGRFIEELETKFQLKKVLEILEKLDLVNETLINEFRNDKSHLSRPLTLAFERYIDKKTKCDPVVFTCCTAVAKETKQVSLVQAMCKMQLPILEYAHSLTSLETDEGKPAISYDNKLTIESLILACRYSEYTSLLGQVTDAIQTGREKHDLKLSLEEQCLVARVNLQIYLGIRYDIEDAIKYATQFLSQIFRLSFDEKLDKDKEVHLEGLRSDLKTFFESLERIHTQECNLIEEYKRKIEDYNKRKKEMALTGNLELTENLNLPKKPSDPSYIHDILISLCDMLDKNKKDTQPGLIHTEQAYNFIFEILNRPILFSSSKKEDESKSNLSSDDSNTKSKDIAVFIAAYILALEHAAKSLYHKAKSQKYTNILNLESGNKSFHDTNKAQAYALIVHDLSFKHNLVPIGLKGTKRILGLTCPSTALLNPTGSTTTLVQQMTDAGDSKSSAHAGSQQPGFNFPSDDDLKILEKLAEANEKLLQNSLNARANAQNKNAPENLTGLNNQRSANAGATISTVSDVKKNTSAFYTSSQSNIASSVSQLSASAKKTEVESDIFETIPDDFEEGAIQLVDLWPKKTSRK